MAKARKSDPENTHSTQGWTQPDHLTVVPQGVHDQDVSEADRLAGELSILRKRTKEVCREIGAIWKRMLLSAEDKTACRRWISLRCGFGLSTVSTYSQLADVWDQTVQKARDGGIDWEHLTVNDFLSLYRRKHRSQQQDDRRDLGKPDDPGKNTDSQEALPTTASVQLSTGSLPSRRSTKGGGKGPPRTDPVVESGEDPVTGFLLLAASLQREGRLEFRRVKPGQAKVQVADKPVLLVPDRGVADSVKESGS